MSTKKEPQDRKPPARAEAEGDTTATLEFKGEQFTIDTDPDNWTVEALLAFEEGKVVSAIKGVLGPTQWRKFAATRPQRRDLGEFYSELARVFGLGDAGE